MPVKLLHGVDWVHHDEIVVYLQGSHTRESRKHLIYCFCSLAFSEDHEPRWDPTIRRMRVGGIQYDITVCINESHGTRVSEACLKVRGWNISEGRGTCHIKGFLEGLTETARMSFPDRSLPICGSTKGLAKTVRASLVLS